MAFGNDELWGVSDTIGFNAKTKRTNELCDRMTFCAPICDGWAVDMEITIMTKYFNLIT